jgi:hypothetical protein
VLKRKRRPRRADAARPESKHKRPGGCQPTASFITTASLRQTPHSLRSRPYLSTVVPRLITVLIVSADPRLRRRQTSFVTSFRC